MACSTKFLRLSNNLVNTRYIKNVEIHPSLFRIVLNSEAHNGFVMFGSGWLSNESHTFNIYKDKNSKDYDIVSRWVEEMSR